MPYTINVNVNQIQQQNPVEPKNPAAVDNPTAPSKRKSPTEISFKKKIAIGGALAVGTGTILNRVGTYTNDPILSRTVNATGTMIGIGALALVNPVAGGVALVTTLGFKIVDEQIQIHLANVTSEYNRQLTGNTSDTGNRWKGQKE